MKGYVYILKDDNGRFYIGSTREPIRRYKRHLSGFVFTTHRMRNPKIVFTQEYDSFEAANKIERKLKNLKRKDYIEKILKDGYIKITVR